MNPYKSKYKWVASETSDKSRPFISKHKLIKNIHLTNTTTDEVAGTCKAALNDRQKLVHNQTKYSKLKYLSSSENRKTVPSSVTKASSFEDFSPRSSLLTTSSKSNVQNEIRNPPVTTNPYKFISTQKTSMPASTNACTVSYKTANIGPTNRGIFRLERGSQSAMKSMEVVSTPPIYRSQYALEHRSQFATNSEVVVLQSSVKKSQFKLDHKSQIAMKSQEVILKPIVRKSRFKLEHRSQLYTNSQEVVSKSAIPKAQLKLEHRSHFATNSKVVSQSNGRRSRFKLDTRKSNISPQQPLVKSRFKLDLRKLEVRKRRLSATHRIASALVKRSRYKIDARRKGTATIPSCFHNYTVQQNVFKFDRRSNAGRTRRIQRLSSSGSQLIISRHSLKRLTTSYQNNVQTYRAVVKRAKKNLTFRRKPPCLFFVANGTCRNGDACYFRHDVDAIRICPRYLLKLCPHDANSCPLAHCLDERRLPICAFYERGVCAKDACPFLHIKHSADTPVCREFQQGLCSRGRLCPRRHVWKKKQPKKGKDVSLSKSCAEPVLPETFTSTSSIKASDKLGQPSRSSSQSNQARCAASSVEVGQPSRSSSQSNQASCAASSVEADKLGQPSRSSSQSNQAICAALSIEADKLSQPSRSSSQSNQAICAASSIEADKLGQPSNSLSLNAALFIPLPDDDSDFDEYVI